MIFPSFMTKKTRSVAVTSENAEVNHQGSGRYRDACSRSGGLGSLNQDGVIAHERIRLAIKQAGPPSKRSRVLASFPDFKRA